LYPEVKKNAYNLRTRLIRHLSNATPTPSGPSSEDRTSKDFLKNGAVPPQGESKKHRAKLLRIVLVLGVSDAFATAATQKILILVHRAHLWTERLAGFSRGRKRLREQMRAEQVGSANLQDRAP
jgi:hypothetical protein